MTRRGAEWHVRARQSESWSGSRGESRYGVAGHVVVRHVVVRPGSAVQARRGMARCVLVGHDRARRGSSWQSWLVMERIGGAGQGLARQSWPVRACWGRVSPGAARRGSLGLLRRVRAGSVKAWHGSQETQGREARNQKGASHE